MERGEKERDFRRLGGKKPRLRRERRAISMGCGKLGRVTQESWVYGWSSDAVVTEMEGEVGTLERGVSLWDIGFAEGLKGWMVVVGVCIVSSGHMEESPLADVFSGATVWPLTPQASRGR